MRIRFQRFTDLSSTADDQVPFAEAMSAAADDFDLTFFACPILLQQTVLRLSRFLRAIETDRALSSKPLRTDRLGC